MGTRRMFTREFKLEAVKLVTERDVKVSQAARDLGIGENVLGRKARRKRRRLPGDTGVRPENSIAPNVLDWQFVATAPNQRWVTR